MGGRVVIEAGGACGLVVGGFNWLIHCGNNGAVFEKRVGNGGVGGWWANMGVVFEEHSI